METRQGRRENYCFVFAEDDGCIKHENKWGKSEKKGPLEKFGTSRERFGTFHEKSGALFLPPKR
jgi:hypothetical protein